MKKILFSFFLITSMFTVPHDCLFGQVCSNPTYNCPIAQTRTVFADYSSFYYPISCHWIYALSAFQDSLVIEDGSVWQVDSYQCHKLRSWFANDPIVITQNREWFSSHKYRIINKNLNMSVPASLSAGPVLDGEYSRFVALIDQFRFLVILSDNSQWKISPYDEGEFLEWALNDSVIVGVNSDWSMSYPYILINVNLNKYIHAKQN